MDTNFDLKKHNINQYQPKHIQNKRRPRHKNVKVCNHQNVEQSERVSHSQTRELRLLPFLRLLSIFARVVLFTFETLV